RLQKKVPREFALNTKGDLLRVGSLVVGINRQFMGIGDEPGIRLGGKRWVGVHVGRKRNSCGLRRIQSGLQHLAEICETGVSASIAGKDRANRLAEDKRGLIIEEINRRQDRVVVN